MTDQPRRLAAGGRIDRGRPLRFRFDGREMSGFAGDTLASALLANGIRLVGRSFKLHRPRGLLGHGLEEPNALVDVAVGEGRMPNLRATEVVLHDGLDARSQNRWPSLRLDVAAVNDRLSALLPAGFYYKTLMWPSWSLFEGPIRRLAGLGKLSPAPHPPRASLQRWHADLLVIGAGPAGLAAALASSPTQRVLVAEARPAPGGRLLYDPAEIDGMAGVDWAKFAAMQVAAHDGSRLLCRTVALGAFDDGLWLLLESRADGRERLWEVRAKSTVLATGATERPIVFPGNDRPGVMLAESVRAYLGLQAVRAGDNALLVTCNDAAYATAERLVASGGKVAALVDTRAEVPGPLMERALALGIDPIVGGSVLATRGRHAISAARISGANQQARWVKTDLLIMSGGFSPNVQLHAQLGGRTVWDAAQQLFRPLPGLGLPLPVGGAAGTLGLTAALAEGHGAGGGSGRAPAAIHATSPAVGTWALPAHGQKAFVDFQNDVTADDVALAAREGYRSVEHLKRYTTLGMAPDQGKTSNVNGAALLAEATGLSIAATGTTRFRFPTVPASLAALSAGRRGLLFRPMRQLTLHQRHRQAGAVFEELGGWERPVAYLRPGEDRVAAEAREALAVRTGAGLLDASPLGKIEVVGPDAGFFLDRIYANRMSDLAVGRIRYGMMLTELGTILDDGVVARLKGDHWLVGTTSGNADRIAAWLEEWLQCEWTNLRLVIAPVTTAFCVLTLAGPAAPQILAAAGAEFPLDRGSFPHMRSFSGSIGDLPVRVLRVSFSGEASFEINLRPGHSVELWDRLMAAGEDHGLQPIGTDALLLLRTEKGFLHVGIDTDGTTLPQDVGWQRVLKRADDFIGKRSLFLPHAQRADRPQLVGLRSPDAKMLPVGAHLSKRGGQTSEGYVTSSAFSPLLRQGVALGMVQGGSVRLGETLSLLEGGGPVEICAACILDPAGERLG